MWDGANIVQHSQKTADGSVIQEIEYLYEPESFRPLAQVTHKANQDSQLHYIVTDHAGTPQELCSENGEVVWQGEQALWGHYQQKNVLPNHGFRENTHNDELYCDLRYQGQIEDRESGLYYNVNRYYDAGSGQYLSPDPIGFAGWLRPQAYVFNPLEWVDPLGLAGCPKWVPKEVEGRKVYQRDDLIDPNRIDDLGKSNLERMQKGSAPVGADGQEINLHHLTQDEPGPMAEVGGVFHSTHDRVLHLYSNQWDKSWVGPDGVRRTYNSAPPSMNRSPFNSWKKRYWKARARDFT